MTDEELIAKAADVRHRAYARYSSFAVGAALLDDNGNVHTGCNVENASYGLTICAERAAVCAAVSSGVTTFQTLALVLPEAGTPCGACRQVLAEFSPNLRILIADANDLSQQPRDVSLARLLPESFTFRPDGENG